MAWLAAGLLLFLGAHSVQIFASGLREAVIRRLGAGPWKGLYSLISVAGFALRLTLFRNLPTPGRRQTLYIL